MSITVAELISLQDAHKYAYLERVENQAKQVINSMKDHARFYPFTRTFTFEVHEKRPYEIDLLQALRRLLPEFHVFIGVPKQIVIDWSKQPEEDTDNGLSTPTSDIV